MKCRLIGNYYFTPTLDKEPKKAADNYLNCRLPYHLKHQDFILLPKLLLQLQVLHQDNIFHERYPRFL